ncbi:MAG TPA: hypothetical protein ENK02_11480, partial [Planctomycetes bacterium]|nr:hypothetical protein [Planctomycetota bacterium]
SLPLPALAQQPRANLLADLNPDPVGTVKTFNPPRVLARLGKNLVLSLWSFQTGEELWVTQGTPSTTKLLKDIVPGRGDSSPRLVGVLGNKVFFFAETPGKGRELWVSDGTQKGTRFFMELVGGKGGAQLGGEIQHMVTGNKLFFLFPVSSQSDHLWVTDGTAQGTRYLSGFSRLPATGSPSYDFHDFGGKLFFSTAGGNREAWISDGTLSGTQPILPVRTLTLQDPSFHGPGAIRKGIDMFFFAKSKSSGWDLYSSNGTRQGTRFRLELGKGVVPGPLFTAPGHLIWILPGPKSSLVSVDKNLKPKVLLQWGSELTFKGFMEFPTKTDLFFTNASGKSLAYSTDGTQAGTRLDIPSTSHRMNPGQAYPLGKKVLFYQGFGVRWLAVWDRASRTFAKLATEAPGLPIFNDGSRVFYSTPNHPRLKNGTLSFLWQSDGTSAGTRVVPLGRGFFPTLGSQGILFLPWGQGRTRILTASAPVGRGLFEVQGAGKSLKSLGNPKNLLPIPSPFSLQTHFGKHFFYETSYSLRQVPLWVTDGTPSGTKVLGTLRVNARKGEKNLARLGDRVLISERLQTSPGGLWSSDGTVAGTRFLMGKQSRVPPNSPYQLTRIGNRVFFYGSRWIQGKSLFYAYLTDGSPQGNLRLPFGPYTAFQRGGLGSFAKWGKWVVYPFHDASVVSLQGYDPVAKKGTTLLRQRYSPIRQLLPLGDALLLRRAINFKSQKLEVLRLVQGKVQIQQLQLFPEYDDPQLFRVQDRIFAWVPSNKRHLGFEVWGNQGGTSPLKRLFQLPSHLVLDLRRTQAHPLGSRKAILMPYSQKTRTRELWVVDLVAKTSAPLGYQVPKTASTLPYGFQLSGGNLFFFAEDEVHGTEPWIWAAGASGRRIGVGCSSAAIRTPELEVQDPVLGTGIQIRGQDAPQGGIALLALGLPMVRSLVLPGQSCRLHFDLARPWIPVKAFAVPTGPVWRQKLNIPNSTKLLGLTAVWQAIYPVPGGRLETSNGYESTFGK